MSLFEQLSQDLIEAQKSRDEVRVSTLRFLISGLKNARIAKGSDLADEEVQAEIAKDAKRHKESIDAFGKAGRAELAEKEQKELSVLEAYLPEQMSDQELEGIAEDVISSIGAVSLGDMGRVMGAVMGKVKGQADGNRVSAIVKAKLNP